MPSANVTSAIDTSSVSRRPGPAGGHRGDLLPRARAPTAAGRTGGCRGPSSARRPRSPRCRATARRSRRRRGTTGCRRWRAAGGPARRPRPSRRSRAAPGPKRCWNTVATARRPRPSAAISASSSASDSVGGFSTSTVTPGRAGTPAPAARASTAGCTGAPGRRRRRRAARPGSGATVGTSHASANAARPVGVDVDDRDEPRPVGVRRAGRWRGQPRSRRCRRSPRGSRYVGLGHGWRHSDGVRKALSCASLPAAPAVGQGPRRDRQHWNWASAQTAVAGMPPSRRVVTTSSTRCTDWTSTRHVPSAVLRAHRAGPVQRPVVAPHREPDPGRIGVADRRDRRHDGDEQVALGRPRDADPAERVHAEAVLVPTPSTSIGRAVLGLVAAVGQVALDRAEAVGDRGVRQVADVARHLRLRLPLLVTRSACPGSATATPVTPRASTATRPEHDRAAPHPRPVRAPEVRDRRHGAAVGHGLRAQDARRVHGRQLCRTAGGQILDPAEHQHRDRGHHARPAASSAAHHVVPLSPNCSTTSSATMPPGRCHR